MASTKSFRELVGMSPSTASTKDSVLVIIDAQNEYATGHLETVNISSTRAAISSLLEKYRAASAPLVHILHAAPAGSPVFTPDTHLAQEFDELKPKAGEKVISKEQPGSFTGTDLQEFLEKSGRKKLVLTGYMAHVCVSTTARQADERGWDVLLASDAVGDRDIPGVKAGELVDTVLKELGDSFGTVVESKDIK